MMHEKDKIISGIKGDRWKLGESEFLFFPDVAYYPNFSNITLLLDHNNMTLLSLTIGSTGSDIHLVSHHNELPQITQAITYSDGEFCGAFLYRDCLRPMDGLLVHAGVYVYEAGIVVAHITDNKFTREIQLTDQTAVEYIELDNGGYQMVDYSNQKPLLHVFQQGATTHVGLDLEQTYSMNFHPAADELVKAASLVQNGPLVDMELVEVFVDHLQAAWRYNYCVPG